MQLAFLAVTADPETPEAYQACSFQTCYESNVSLDKFDEFQIPTSSFES